MHSPERSATRRQNVLPPGRNLLHSAAAAPLARRAAQHSGVWALPLRCRCLRRPMLCALRTRCCDRRFDNARPWPVRCAQLVAAAENAPDVVDDFEMGAAEAAAAVAERPENLAKLQRRVAATAVVPLVPPRPGKKLLARRSAAP